MKLSTLLDLDSSVDNQMASVATYLRYPIRETPNVLSVFTEYDIVNSGARDLRELLMVLPGTDFEIDVQNNLGMGIRGLWGEEGKILILWDGHVMNEAAYGTFAFNQHIYLGNIKRVEVIRGPGSSIYGGMAGLAVINITSKNYSDSYKPGFISQSIGVSENKLSHHLTQFGIGKKLKNGLALNFTGTIATANISNRLSRENINYSDSSLIETHQFGIQGTLKNFNFSALYDGHKVEIVDEVGKSIFSGLFTQLNYQWKISEKLSVLPTLLYRIQEPWNYQGVPGPFGDSLNMLSHRSTAGIRLQYEPSGKTNFVVGLEHISDNGIYSIPTQSFSNGNNKIQFTNWAVYGQFVHHTQWANLSAGVRIDRHSAFGPAIVPRIGLTKIINNWHIKGAFSNAFKAPNIVTLDANDAIEPERISTYEMESGFQFNAGLSISGNLYYTKIKNPIIYASLNGLDNEYINGNQMETAGLEIAAELSRNWGKLIVNYSYYSALKDQTPQFMVTDNPTMRYGFPTHKIVGHTSVALPNSFSISGTAIFQTKKYYQDFVGDVVSKPSILQLNITLKKQSLFYNGLSLEVGIFNLLNQTLWNVTPYNLATTPTPQMGREFAVKLIFNIGH